MSEQFELELFELVDVVNDEDVIVVAGVTVVVTFAQFLHDLAQYKLNGFPCTAAPSHVQYVL
jgi:hypothetical protein